MSANEMIESASLRANALGVGAITFFVVSAAGPLIAMAGGLPVSMLLGNGAGIPAMFAAALLVLLIFAAGFTDMAQYVRNAGGFYAFAARGLGGYAGAMTATIAVFSYSTIQLGMYALFGATVAEPVNSLIAANVPWWVYSLAALATIAVLGYRSVDLSVKVLSILVACEYLVIGVLDAAILQKKAAAISWEAFSPHTVNTGSPAIGLLLCFTAFIGFEATTIYAEEAREPARTIPVATYVSLLLIGFFYIFSSWCTVVAVGAAQLLPTLDRLPDPTSFLFILSDANVGSWLTGAMRLLFITSTFAGLLAFHNSIARYAFALGREGLLPAVLGRTHAIFKSPHRASAVQSGASFLTLMVFVLAGANPVTTIFARASGVGTLGIIAAMGVTSVAVVAFFRRRPGGFWRSRFLPVVATLALLYVGILGCLRFDALAGGSSALVMWLPWLVVCAAAVGLILAKRLKDADAPRFAGLGGNVP